MGTAGPRCFSGTAPPSGVAAAGGSLVVVVAPSCTGYDTAVQLAALAQELRPWVRIRLLRPQELDDRPDLVRPDEPILGTPTYLLDGRTVFLGNPDLSALLDLLDRDDEEREA